MGRFTFWLLLAASLVAAGAVYVLEVSDASGDLSSQLEVLDGMSERAERLSATGVGPPTVGTMKSRQKKARSQIAGIEARFRQGEEDNVEHWFPGLRMSWKKQPLREDFKRYYNLGVDQLRRDASNDLEKHGIEDPELHLIEYEWMQGSDLPPNDDLRALQQEFWVQDRLIRAFARVGGVLTRPIRGGERQNAVSRTAGGHFDHVRYDAQVRCSPTNLRRVLHALDRPFDVTFVSGETESMFLNAVVDNVAVRRISVDTATANRYAGEPPIEVSFFITLLDMQESAKEKGKD